MAHHQLSRVHSISKEPGLTAVLVVLAAIWVILNRMAFIALSVAAWLAIGANVATGRGHMRIGPSVAGSKTLGCTGRALAIG